MLGLDGCPGHVIMLPPDGESLPRSGKVRADSDCIIIFIMTTVVHRNGGYMYKHLSSVGCSL